MCSERRLWGISMFGGQVEARAQQRRLKRLGSELAAGPGSQEEWEEAPVREWPSQMRMGNPRRWSWGVTAEAPWGG